jgi:outer membrane lipopolysaccharide assembly protein LptE/RlpB
MTLAGRIHSQRRWQSVAVAGTTERQGMKTILCIPLLLALAACGVETAGTAATAAALKKQELEQARQTQEQVRQKLEEATQRMQQRADQAGDEK